MVVYVCFKQDANEDTILKLGWDKVVYVDEIIMNYDAIVF